MKINGIKYDYKEIFNAWITARNPSDDEKKLAERRYYICPLLKWEECDNGFIEKIEDKREKSII
jgi:hypothetical protein